MESLLINKKVTRLALLFTFISCLSFSSNSQEIPKDLKGKTPEEIFPDKAFREIVTGASRVPISGKPLELKHLKFVTHIEPSANFEKFMVYNMWVEKEPSLEGVISSAHFKHRNLLKKQYPQKKHLNMEGLQYLKSLKHLHLSYFESFSAPSITKKQLPHLKFMSVYDSSELSENLLKLPIEELVLKLDKQRIQFNSVLVQRKSEKLQQPSKLIDCLFL